MTVFAFSQVDVFSDTPTQGNPVAVVHDASGLSDQQMAAFARWTNLSETTFLLPANDTKADYRLRIFTPGGELPFAGHPTLGSCYAWLARGGQPKGDRVVQECGAGLVTIKRDENRLAFAAPPLLRTGPMSPRALSTVLHSLGVSKDDILGHQWIDNGPGWCGVLMKNPQQLLALSPDFLTMGQFKVGVIAPIVHPEYHFVVRAFVPSLGVPEDPVTGSLNAGLAQWLIKAGIAPRQYVVSQGTCMQRDGRVFISALEKDIWVGGNVVGTLSGELNLPTV